MTGVRGVHGGVLRRLRRLGFEFIALPGSGETLDGAAFNHVAGSTVAGATLTKTAGVGWNAGAISSQVAYGDCSLTWTVPAHVTTCSGLSHIPSNLVPTAIPWSMYLDSGGTGFPYELGVAMTAPIAYAAGDEFKIDVAAGVVTYYQRTPPGAWALLYTSLAAATFPLLFDACLSTVGAVLANITLTGFTSYRRVSSVGDFARRKYTLTQALDYRRPAFIPGDPCAWRFEKARGDVLWCPAVPIGTAPYTAVALYQYQSLPSVLWEQRALFVNGVWDNRGFSFAHAETGTDKEIVYHFGPGVTSVGATDLNMRSTILRHDGANLLWRTNGADDPPAALAAQAAPAGGDVLKLGALDIVGGYAADVDLYLAAIATRSLSAGDMTELSATLLAGWGV
jgi:hypothetical protein